MRELQIKNTCFRFGKGLFLLAFLAGNVSALLGQPGQPAKKNVLFIAVDDLNTVLSCYGNTLVKTPNIDRLASRGMRFERAYCQVPVCSPSRTSFLTGMRPETSGIYFTDHFRKVVPDVVTLPQLFRQNGYYTARVGKIFHQSVPDDIGKNGRDDSLSWQQALNPIGRDKTEENKLTSLTPAVTSLGGAFNYLAAEGTDGEQTDGKVASEAIRLLQEKKNEAFFLAVGFYRPHLPFVAPKKYFDLYPLNKILLAKSVPDDQADMPALSTVRVTPANYGLTEDAQRQTLRGYYASVSFVDAQIGRVLDELDRLKLTDNTIVLLGDHGFLLGEHGMWQKNSLLEQSAQVTLIIAAPGIKKNAASASLVELLDVYPTLTELSGLPAARHLEGKSLVPVLHNPKVEVKKAAYTLSESRSAGNALGRSVRTDRWRYSEWDEGKQGMELYDHQQDPGEFVNLALKPEHQTTVGELQQLLRQGVPLTARPIPKEKRKEIRNK